MEGAVGPLKMMLRAPGARAKHRARDARVSFVVGISEHLKLDIRVSFFLSLARTWLCLIHEHQLWVLLPRRLRQKGTLLHPLPRAQNPGGITRLQPQNPSLGELFTTLVENSPVDPAPP